MEMHSQSSLYEIHGISAREDARLRLRWTKGIFALLRRVISALRGELEARRAARELSKLDDRMLRDIGISRSEIQQLVRQPPYTQGDHYFSLVGGSNLIVPASPGATASSALDQKCARHHAWWRKAGLPEESAISDQLVPEGSSSRPTAVRA